MKTILAAVALVALSAPALAQTPRTSSGYETTSPEPGFRAQAAARAQASGMGTPQIAPNGSSYVPSNRGFDPAAGYSPLSVPPAAVR